MIATTSIRRAAASTGTPAKEKGRSTIRGLDRAVEIAKGCELPAKTAPLLPPPALLRKFLGGATTSDHCAAPRAAVIRSLPEDGNAPCATPPSSASAAARQWRCSLRPAHQVTAADSATNLNGLVTPDAYYRPLLYHLPREPERSPRTPRKALTCSQRDCPLPLALSITFLPSLVRTAEARAASNGAVARAGAGGF